MLFLGSLKPSTHQSAGQAQETNHLQMVIPVDGLCKKMNTLLSKAFQLHLLR